LTKQNVLLGDFLVSQGLINDEQLHRALKYQKEKGKMLGRSLIDLEILSEPDMIKALSQQLGVQYVSLKTYRIDPAVINLVPEHVARGFQVLPLFRIDETLTVGMVNPLDVVAIDAITRACQLKVAPVVCSEVDLRDAIDHHYGGAPPVAQSVGEEKFVQVVPPGRDDGGETVPQRRDASPGMAKMLEALLLAARRNNANHVHLETTGDALLVRHRIDGRLAVAGQHPLRLAAPLINQLKLQAGLDSASRNLPQQGRLQITVDGEIIDVGFSIIPAAHGESVVLRLRDRSVAFRLDELNLPAPVLDAVKAVLAHPAPAGLLIVASPDGNGRTATLYALLRALQSAEKNLVTLEESIEQSIDGCRQMRISTTDGLGFAEGFQAALQQDADVIMASHVRDEETARLAVSAALDGKFVLLGIPAHDAAAAIVRVLDLSVKPNLLAATLRAALAQRLVRKICEQCKHAEPASPEIRRMLPRLFDEPTTVYRGRGCAACNGTGYRGRTLLAELLPGNEAVQSLLRNTAATGLSATELKKHQLGNLFQDGIEKMLQGVTTWEEVMRASTTG
jgi:type IV pilus assembly protein PilB